MGAASGRKEPPTSYDFLPEFVEKSYARHETFHVRFGWLKKGFDRAVDSSDVFLAEDATVRLGVGKNMVRSIRYWCRAFKLLEDDQPTDFGRRLLGMDGWDPYLEDPASLWLLHWRLLEPTCEAAAWYFAFNHLRSAEFTAETLTDELTRFATQDGTKVAESSLKKDAICLLRTYATQGASGRKGMHEDSLDCPFAELGLIERMGDARHYRFRMGEKRSLPPEVVVAAVLEFAARRSSQASTVSIASLLYDPGSPGQVFKLTESALYGAIDRGVRDVEELRVSDAGGIVQVEFDGDPLNLAARSLARYYTA
jgi:hypothetical protein